MNLSRTFVGLRRASCINHYLCLSSFSFNNFNRETAVVFPNHVDQHRQLSNKPPKIDKSRVPELREEDLEEKFIRGWGPGGQCINKTSSAVYLRHTPTGLFVKCQVHRGQHQNRKEARLLLQEKWDDLLNGEYSVAAQRKRLLEVKSAKRTSKTKKRLQLQADWKKSLEKDAAADDGNESVTFDDDKGRNVKS